MLSNLKNRQKNDDFCRKNLVLFKKMALPLPLDQFRFNVVLWILITAYWISGIWNFMAFVPGWTKDDAKMIWYNKSNYSFWLISSLLFFILWISQFHYKIFVYLTMWEIYLTIILYLYLTTKKRCYLKTNKKKAKEKKKEKIEVIQ